MGCKIGGEYGDGELEVLVSGIGINCCSGVSVKLGGLQGGGRAGLVCQMKWG